MSNLMNDPDLDCLEDYFDEDDFQRIIVDPLKLDGDLRSSDGYELGDIETTDEFDWR